MEIGGRSPTPRFIEKKQHTPGGMAKGGVSPNSGNCSLKAELAACAKWGVDHDDSI